MPEFVTCTFVKRLKTKEFEEKKLKNSDFGEKKRKKTEMIVCETWKIYKKWVNGLGFFEKI